MPSIGRYQSPKLILIDEKIAVMPLIFSHKHIGAKHAATLGEILIAQVDPRRQLGFQIRIRQAIWGCGTIIGRIIMSVNQIPRIDRFISAQKKS